MTTPVTNAPKASEVPEDVVTTPTTRRAAREARAAQQKQEARAVKQARKTARRAAKGIPNPYAVGDQVRYTDRAGVSFPAGKVIAVTGREVVVEFHSGIDFRLDHRDPGLSTVRFS